MTARKRIWIIFIELISDHVIFFTSIIDIHDKSYSLLIVLKGKDHKTLRGVFFFFLQKIFWPPICWKKCSGKAVDKKHILNSESRFCPYLSVNCCSLKTNDIACFARCLLSLFVFVLIGTWHHLLTYCLHNLQNILIFGCVCPVTNVSFVFSTKYNLNSYIYSPFE